MEVQEQTLENLLELKTIFKGDDVNEQTNVFSTNVFIPENIVFIDIKTYNYFTGFIKLTETFNYRTDKSWILIIYIDKMFVDDSGDIKQTYNSINTSPHVDNKKYNSYIKKTFSKNHELKKNLNMLLSLYKQYIIQIIKNKNNYKRIKIISYKCRHLNNNKYLGHTSTFGSIIRFLPIFEKNLYEHIVCINISHAISVFFFCEINKWIQDNGTLIMTICSLYGDIYDIEESANLCKMMMDLKIIDLNNITRVYSYYSKYRLLAGLFGIKKKKSSRERRKTKYRQM